MDYGELEITSKQCGFPYWLDGHFRTVAEKLRGPPDFFDRRRGIFPHYQFGDAAHVADVKHTQMHIPNILGSFAIRVRGCSVALVLCLVPTAWAQTGDTVYIAGGDQNSGRVASVNSDNLVLETQYAGSITIKTTAIARILIDGHEFTPSSLDQLQAELAARNSAAPKAEPTPETPATPTTTIAPPGAEGALGFIKQFSGSAGLGFTLLQGTNSTRGLTADLNLYRASLDKVGQAPRTETGLIFNQGYSEFKPKTGPTNKSENFAADLSHAVRLRGKWSAFGQAAFEHASAEGLDLLQLYAGGLGFTAWNDNNGNRFEIRGGVDVVKKAYMDPKLSHSLLGGIIEEQYSKTLPSGLAIKEQYRIDRAFSHPEEVDALGLLSVEMPVNKIFAIRTSLTHRYLNVVPRGDKRNAFEASAGIDVTIGAGKTSSAKAKRRVKKKKNKK